MLEFVNIKDQEEKDKNAKLLEKLQLQKKKSLKKGKRQDQKSSRRLTRKSSTPLNEEESLDKNQNPNEAPEEIDKTYKSLKK